MQTQTLYNDLENSSSKMGFSISIVNLVIDWINGKVMLIQQICLVQQQAAQVLYCLKLISLYLSSH